MTCTGLRSDDTNRHQVWSYMHLWPHKTAASPWGVAGWQIRWSVAPSLSEWRDERPFVQSSTSVCWGMWHITSTFPHRCLFGFRSGDCEDHRMWFTTSGNSSKEPKQLFPTALEAFQPQSTEWDILIIQMDSWGVNYAAGLVWLSDTSFCLQRNFSQLEWHEFKL